MNEIRKEALKWWRSMDRVAQEAMVYQHFGEIGFFIITSSSLRIEQMYRKNEHSKTDKEIMPKENNNKLIRLILDELRVLEKRVNILESEKEASQGEYSTN